MKTKPMAGLRFGRLIVIAFDKRSSHGALYYWCRCECGTEKSIEGNSIRRGDTVSCGCYSRRISTTHGKSRTPTYTSWRNMIQRCTNPKNKRYQCYGGRGIIVCEKWRQFENFLADMGECPPSYTIERQNNDGNYEPSNCRWATIAEQAVNRSNNSRIEFRGQKRLLRDWAAEIGIDRRTLHRRLKCGWPLERALR